VKFSKNSEKITVEKAPLGVWGDIFLNNFFIPNKFTTFAN